MRVLFGARLKYFYKAFVASHTSTFNSLFNMSNTKRATA